MRLGEASLAQCVVSHAPPVTNANTKIDRQDVQNIQRTTLCTRKMMKTIKRRKIKKNEKKKNNNMMVCQLNSPKFQ